MFGIHDYNRAPLAPLGTKSFVHERSTQRRTFADHGKIGYTIGPCKLHYRHLDFYIPETRATRVTDTYVFLPTKFELPATAMADRTTMALEELTAALNDRTLDTIPVNDQHDLNRQLQRIRTILTPQPAPTPATTTSPAAGAPRVDRREPAAPPRVNNGNGSTRVLRSQAQDRRELAAPPRVNSGNGSTRVLRSQSRAPVYAQKYTRGTRVYKMFDGPNGRLVCHRGIITDFDTAVGYYKVRYEDTDTEEYDEEQIGMMRHKPNYTNIAQALSATRHERVEAEYMNTQASFNIPTKFSNGYSRAIEVIEATQHLNEGLLFQGYKYANSVIDEETGRALEYRHLIQDPKYKKVWNEAGCKEFGRLFQGYGKNANGTKIAEGTNTCHWIRKNLIPAKKKVTYARTVVDIRPEKEDPNRVRITAGGDRLDYYGETSTETASLETAKILINSVLSTKNARFMAIDISNFYIQTDLPDYQYMRFHKSMIPANIIDEYNLTTMMDDDGWCYAEIRKCVYGLKESGYLANIELKRILAIDGYIPSKFTPGLYFHKTRDISFSLVVDDFGVKYTKKEDAEHLVATLKKRYPIKTVWEPDYYLGITLEFDYVLRTCKMSMPGYVLEALLYFQHTNDNNTYGPSPYTAPVYGRKTQMARIDDTDPMNQKQIKLLQRVCGKFLYYARAVDCTMLHALNDLATRTHNGTQETMTALTHFLNYCATNPDSVVTHRASDMILHNHSDAAYLVASEARSRAGGFTYLGNNKNNMQIINGSISVIAKIIKSVMSSAAESEVGALFMNAREILPLRMTCEELGYPQPATPMRTDNNTADGIINGTFQ